MASCKTCEDMQENPEGTAPVRVKYNQPTMYDHMPNFSQFSQTNEREKNIRLVQEKLVSESSKNANIEWPENVEDVLKNFNTQQLAQFQKATKEYMDRLSEDISEANSTSEQMHCKKCKSDDTLVNISRSPVNCPVTSCPNTIGITSVLSHFLRDHQQKFNVELQELTAGRRSILLFDEEVFSNFNENVCLGLLTYAGKSLSKEARPATVGLCLTNSFLPEKYSYLVNHLPLLILGCKTSLTALLHDRELAEELTNLNDPTQDVIVVWLATVETTKPMHCTITAFNRENSTSRSTIVEVRRLKQPQEPHNFMSRESNYLRLTRGEIDLLSKNRRNGIELEIVIHEYE